MKKKLYLLITLLVALAVAGGSFAYTATAETATVTINSIGVSGAFANVTTVTPITGSYASGSAPSWSPSVNSAGSVTAGDIYYVDLGTYTGDIIVTLYINNPAALAKYYSYINLPIVVYKGVYTAGTPGTWAWNPTPVNGKSVNNFTSYLGISTGYVSFIVANPGVADSHVYFAIAVGGGSYYCTSTSATGGSLSPQFFLDVKQA